MGGTQEQDLFSGTKSNATAVVYMVLNFPSISNADCLLIPEPGTQKLSTQVKGV